jgi:hypothetical protein
MTREGEMTATREQIPLQEQLWMWALASGLRHEKKQRDSMCREQHRQAWKCESNWPVQNVRKYHRPGQRRGHLKVE